MKTVAEYDEAIRNLTIERNNFIAEMEPTFENLDKIKVKPSARYAIVFGDGTLAYWWNTPEEKPLKPGGIPGMLKGYYIWFRATGKIYDRDGNEVATNIEKVKFEKPKKEESNDEEPEAKSKSSKAGSRTRPTKAQRQGQSLA